MGDERIVAQDADQAADANREPERASVRYPKGLEAGQVEDDADGPEEDDVVQADETEEQLHVDPRLVADLDLRRRSRQGSGQYEKARTFMTKT